MATTGLTDRQGGTWVCTREHGIFYMPPRRVRANTVPYVDEEEAFGMHDSQGRLWHTDTEGLTCHTAQGTIRYRQAESAPLPGARNVKEVEGLYHNDMNFITPLPDGRLLLCNMMNVLGYFSPEACTFTCLNERLPAISRHRFLVGACPTAEENRVLVYAQDGAFILNTRADTLCDFPARETIEHYSDKYNCALQARDKRLWVGTQNGLFVVENGKAGSATRISGLANDCIRSLVEDEGGNIWVGTSCGISRVGRGVMNLDESDGIPNAPMTERDARRLADGRLAFRNAWGYTLFHPSDFAPEATTLPVVMVGASVCGRQVADELSDASLPHNQNDLSIQFSALNYAVPAHTHYRHRLRGLTDEWQTAGDGDLATVTYYALPPGRYTFEAQAQVDDGEWGESLQVTFRIRPP